MSDPVGVAWFDATERDRTYVDNTELNVTFFAEPLSQATVEKANGFDVVTLFITSKVSEDVIRQLDASVIVCRSTGYDHVDVAAAHRHNITVCHVPTYGITTVAEHTFGLLLTLMRKIYYAIRRVDTGSFDREGLRGYGLHGKTLGIVGTGNIGTEVIRIANGFSMNIIAYSKHFDQHKAQKLGFEYVSFQSLLEQSDVISIHSPLTEETHHMFDDAAFQAMNGTVIINTARGAIIDTEALLRALENGNVALAGLDVLEEECYLSDDIAYIEQLDRECDLRLILEDHLLMQRDDVLITPHNAFNSEEALQRILTTTVENIRRQTHVISQP